MIGPFYCKWKKNQQQATKKQYLFLFLTYKLKELFNWKIHDGLQLLPVMNNTKYETQIVLKFY
jgi:hypothetical protein